MYSVKISPVDIVTFDVTKSPPWLRFLRFAGA